MSDARFRALERELKAAGRWHEFLVEEVGLLEDPEIVARIVDVLSNRLTAPAGNLLILNTETPVVVRPGVKATFQIMVPMFEGGRAAGEIRCFRYVWTSTGPLAWRLRQRGGRDYSNTNGYIEAGQYSIPLAEDPFLLEQGSALDVEVSSQGAIEASFSLICRYVAWNCWNCRDAGYGHYRWQTPAGEFLTVPCPACSQEAHEHVRGLCLRTQPTGRPA